MIEWYDKEGRPLDRETANVLFGDTDYKRVASTEIGSYWVSTVWLGLDHRYTGEGPPVIFETMVFSKDQREDPDDHGLTDIDCRRYCTEEEALAGHEEAVTIIRATMQEIPEAKEVTDGL